MGRTQLLLTSALLLLLAPWTSLAGIASKMVQYGIVFRVTQSGEPEIVGQLFANDPIDIIGYRPDFDWVRIKFEDDEGYVRKELIQDPELEKEYFDPKTDQLGRRSGGAAYEAALMKAIHVKRPGFLFSGLMTMNSVTKFGLGAGLSYGVFSWETSGYQIGLDSSLYFRTVGYPFVTTVFARYWTPGSQKFGLELFSSLNVLTVQEEEKKSQELSLSYGFGASYAFQLSKKLFLAPSVRLNLPENYGITGLVHLTLSP